tara:strand:+ start:1046 stop:1396 length:351 start_codon:yes stop_codon:yes gene_type:complete
MPKDNSHLFFQVLQKLLKELEEEEDLPKCFSMNLIANKISKISRELKGETVKKTHTLTFYNKYVIIESEKIKKEYGKIDTKERMKEIAIRWEKFKLSNMDYKEELDLKYKQKNDEK